MTEDLVSALALVMIVEGIMPFLAPGRWRLVLLRVIQLDDRSLRTFGLISMGLGLLVLQVVRN